LNFDDNKQIFHDKPTLKKETSNSFGALFENYTIKQGGFEEKCKQSLNDFIKYFNTKNNAIFSLFVRNCKFQIMNEQLYSLEKTIWALMQKYIGFNDLSNGAV